MSTGGVAENADIIYDSSFVILVLPVANNYHTAQNKCYSHNISKFSHIHNNSTWSNISVSTGPGPGPGPLQSNITSVLKHLLDQTWSMCSICCSHFTSATKKETGVTASTVWISYIIEW